MALRVLDDFAHAAVQDARVDEHGRRVYFAAPLGDSPRGMWFHFRVAGGDGRPVTFILTNLERMLGSGNYKRSVPVYRRGRGPWRRTRPKDCGLAEMDLPAAPGGARQARRVFRFPVPCGPAVTEVASCYPYTVEMLDLAMGRWAADRRVMVRTLCRSERGRPLRIVRVGSPAPGRKVIWVLARQHSGEVPGSYAAEGLIDAALGGARWAADLRRRAVLYVCPAVDIDGVAEGMYGKDRTPVDFNRDWCAFPIRPEIRALRRAVDASRRACGGPNGRLMLVVDLHGPSAGDVSFPVPPHPAWAGPGRWRRAWWFAALVERFCPSTAVIRWANMNPRHIDWDGPARGARTASAFHAASGLADCSTSIELTYHWQAGLEQLGPVRPDHWRRMGRAMARAMAAVARGVEPPQSRPLPDPPLHFSPCWTWLNSPRNCTATAAGEDLVVRSDGPEAYAALLFDRPVRLGRGRVVARAEVRGTGRAKCAARTVVFFNTDGLFTGEVHEHSTVLGRTGTLRWIRPARRKRPADSARLALVLRDLTGELTIRRPTAAQGGT